MKLYTSPLSPYSARVRASIYFKGLTVEMIKPSSIGGLASPAFRAISPIGKIPVLVLDDGTILVESDAIVEYLEDTVPTPSLRPHDPRLRAQARMLSRLVELYVMGAVMGLLPMMPVSLHHAPVPRDHKRVDAHLPQLVKALDNVEHYLSKEGSFCVGNQLTTADAALASFVPYVHAVERYLGEEGLIERHRLLSGRVKRFGETPVLQRVFDEVSNAMQERRGEVRAKFGEAVPA
jgi:glutathione S-transferase